MRFPMAAGTMFQPRAVPHPGPIPIEVASEKYPMFAGLCWRLAETNSVTASITGMYLPKIVLPMTEKNAAIPTSQFARIVLHQVDGPSHGDGPDQVPDERQDPEPNHPQHNR